MSTVESEIDEGSEIDQELEMENLEIAKLNNFLENFFGCTVYIGRGSEGSCFQLSISNGEMIITIDIRSEVKPTVVLDCSSLDVIKKILRGRIGKIIFDHWVLDKFGKNDDEWEDYFREISKLLVKGGSIIFSNPLHQRSYGFTKVDTEPDYSLSAVIIPRLTFGDKLVEIDKSVRTQLLNEKKITAIRAEMDGIVRAEFNELKKTAMDKMNEEIRLQHEIYVHSLLSNIKQISLSQIIQQVDVIRCNIFEGYNSGLQLFTKVQMIKQHTPFQSADPKEYTYYIATI